MLEFFNIVIGLGILFLIGRAYFRLRQGRERVQREWRTAEAKTVEYELEGNPHHKFTWHPVNGPGELNTRIINHGDGSIEQTALRSEETKENGGYL